MPSEPFLDGAVDAEVSTDAAAVAGWFIFWDLSRRGWQTLSGSEQRKPAFKADTAEA